MKRLLAKLLILTVIPALGWSAGNIKTHGDANNGSLSSLSETDILYVLQSPYGSGDDAYITGANLSKLIGGRAIYNAVTDGGIVADYTDRLTPGTDQRAAIVSWIQTNGLPNGKEVFFFPPGHYRISEGVGNDTTVVDIDGYDNALIFGIPGKTFFHTAQGMNLAYKNNPFIRFGRTTETKNGAIAGITFVNDPYVTSSTGSTIDNDIKWGWKYYEPHRESQAYEKGDIIVSTDDNWLITVTVAGTSAATEPTWSGATTTDGTCTVTVVALNNWAASTAYTAGDHVKSTNSSNYHTAIGATTRSILIAANSGTSAAAANEPAVARPSAEGSASDTFFQWISSSTNASQTTIRDCEFVGMAGFDQAGGLAFGFAGEGGGLVENCYFRDAQYGGVVSGSFDGWTFRDCRHYKLGGWGFVYGGYNAHGYYVQGARNLWDNCTFDRQFYGLDIKMHGNIANTDVWQNRIVNCRFSNYGWGSVQWVGAGETSSATLVDGADFVLSATSGNTQSAIMQKQGVIANSTFRIFKTAYDDFDWRRPSTLPNAENQGAIEVDVAGVSVIGCDFTDTHGIGTGTDHEWIGTNTPVMVTGCSFQTIYRSTKPLQGTVSATNCQFDFRAKTGILQGVVLETYSRLSNSSVIGSTTGTANAAYGLLVLAGPHVQVDNCQVILTGAGHPVSWGNGTGGAAHVHVSMTNSIIDAPSGTIYAEPRSDASYWRFENNYWNIAGWDYRRLTAAAHETWVWRNERGNLFTSIWDGTQKEYNSGIIRLIPLTARSTNTAGGLVDATATRISSAANIYGVELENNDNASYKSWVGVSENANHWILCSELVAKGDWLTMSATAGQLAPNGTSGSTTRPATGIQARVIDAGTASAGAGRALVEVLEWNR